MGRAYRRLFEAGRAHRRANQFHGNRFGTDACWSVEDRLLIQLCDSLHDECRVADGLWSELRIFFPENAFIEILMLAGFYRMVSYLTDAMELPLKDVGMRSPS